MSEEAIFKPKFNNIKLIQWTYVIIPFLCFQLIVKRSPPSVDIDISKKSFQFRCFQCYIQFDCIQVSCIEWVMCAGRSNNNRRPAIRKAFSQFFLVSQLYSKHSSGDWLKRFGDYIVSLFRNSSQEVSQKKTLLDIINNNRKLLKIQAKSLKNNCGEVYFQ